MICAVKKEMEMLRKDEIHSKFRYPYRLRSILSINRIIISNAVSAYAGDMLEIKEGEVYINGAKQEYPPYSLMSYIVETNNQSLDEEIMRSEYGVSTVDDMNVIGMNTYEMTLTAQAVEKLKKTPLIKSIRPILMNPAKLNFTQWWQQIFPYDSSA